jgi:hypothetical protein
MGAELERSDTGVVEMATCDLKPIIHTGIQLHVVIYC